MRACLSLAFGILLTAGCYALLPFDRSSDFENLSGEAAKLRLGGSWPASIEASANGCFAFAVSTGYDDRRLVMPVGSIAKEVGRERWQCSNT